MAKYTQNYSLALLDLQEENTRLNHKLKEISKMYDLLTEHQNQPDEAQMRKNMEERIRTEFERKFQIKETLINSEVKILKEQIHDLEKRHDEMNRDWQKMKLQAMCLREQKQQLEQRQQKVGIELIKLQRFYEEREKQILNKFNQKMEEIMEQKQLQIEEKDSSILSLEAKIDQIVNINSKTEDEYEKIKDILEAEMKKRKSKEEEHRIEVKKLQKQLKTVRQGEKFAKQQLGEKLKELLEQQSEIKKLKKVEMEMNKKLSKTERQMQKQVNKQKSKTKKALEGLQMVRKYSELEINKSKKKEKSLKNNQKSLILKIKEISSKQSEGMLSTKSSRKNSMQNLNTTQRLSVPTKDSFSPCVSKFVLEQDSGIQQQMEEIQNSRKQNKSPSQISSFFKGQKALSQLHYLKNHQQVPKYHHPSETPSFESQKVLKGVFKANIYQ